MSGGVLVDLAQLGTGDRADFRHGLVDRIRRGIAFGGRQDGRLGIALVRVLGRPGADLVLDRQPGVPLIREFVELGADLGIGHLQQARPVVEDLLADRDQLLVEVGYLGGIVGKNDVLFGLHVGHDAGGHVLGQADACERTCNHPGDVPVERGQVGDGQNRHRAAHEDDQAEGEPEF